MLTDFCLISILLVVAQVLRAWLPWARRYMLPSSMIAGAIGLLLGPQVAGILPFSQTTDEGGSAQLQLITYPGILIVFVFATLLMGHNPDRSRDWRPSRGARVSLLYNLAAEVGQYGLAILIGVFGLAAIYPTLPPQFATMLGAGFAGGYGTASIFGQGFAAQGWADALSVGFAFATIGLLAAIIGGMLLINIAARCGWTAFVRVGDREIHQDSPAFLPEAEQESIGRITANPTALDPLAWHIALLGAVYGITLGVDAAIHWIVPGSYWLPQFAIGMLVGALAQLMLDRIHLGQFVDRQTIRRLGSLAADYLVAFGIAAIKLSVVWQYAGPIVLMSLFGLAYSVGVLLLGAWVFSECWFEQSIFTYGWLTGVVGFSVALLRIVDPKLKSHTLEDYGAAYILIGPAELMLYPAIIWACGAGKYVGIGIVLTVLGGLMFAAARYAARGAKGLRFDGTIAVDSIEGQTIC
jgi:ESS family glutamate:Na+ symporter